MLHGVAVLAPDELRAPMRVAHFAAVGLAIFEDLDLAHLAVAGQRDRVGDQVVLADHRVDEEVAVVGLPGAQRARVDLDAGVALNGRHVRGAQRPAAWRSARSREHQLLRLLDAHVHQRVRGRQTHDRGQRETNSESGYMSLT